MCGALQDGRTSKVISPKPFVPWSSNHPSDGVPDVKRRYRKLPAAVLSASLTRRRLVATSAVVGDPSLVVLAFGRRVHTCDNVTIKMPVRKPCLGRTRSRSFVSLGWHPAIK